MALVQDTGGQPGKVACGSNAPVQHFTKFPEKKRKIDREDTYFKTFRGHDVVVTTTGGVRYTGLLYGAHVDEQGKREYIVTLAKKDDEKPTIKCVVVPSDVCQSICAAEIARTRAHVTVPSAGSARIEDPASFKSTSGHERQLEKFAFDAAVPDPGSGSTSAAAGWSGEDMFRENERLFGVESSFDESMYTTDVHGAAISEAEAERLAQSILAQEGRTAHEREERGQIDDSGLTEEDKYGAVIRQPVSQAVADARLGVGKGQNCKKKRNKAKTLPHIAPDGVQPCVKPPTVTTPVAGKKKTPAASKVARKHHPSPKTEKSLPTDMVPPPPPAPAAGSEAAQPTAPTTAFAWNPNSKPFVPRQQAANKEAGGFAQDLHKNWRREQQLHGRDGRPVHNRGGFPHRPGGAGGRLHPAPASGPGGSRPAPPGRHRMRMHAGQVPGGLFWGPMLRPHGAAPPFCAGRVPMPAASAGPQRRCRGIAAYAP